MQESGSKEPSWRYIYSTKLYVLAHNIDINMVKRSVHNISEKMGVSG